MAVIGLLAAPVATARAQSIYCGPPAQPRVALTFDDGPNPIYTSKVLAMLRRHRVRATFFVTGRAAWRWASLVRSMYADGHLVANHSWDHPKSGTEEQWRRQILDTEAAILAAGVPPARLFRPPYGKVTPAVRRACAALGYDVVLYTLLSPDYRRPGKAPLVAAVLNRATPGGIIVMHDGGGNRAQTAAALPAIISGLTRRKGLQIVRLDVLLGHPLKLAVRGAAHCLPARGRRTQPPRPGPGTLQGPLTAVRSFAR
jgi:peptidoglycan/xylan/chitin deacetylase (PgdA/CDA1 family)